MRSFEIIALVLICGCSSSSSGSSGTQPTGQNNQGSIGSAGGIVQAADGSSVSVPAGALASTVNITLAPNGAAPPAAATLVGDSLIFGPEGQQFAKPATVTLSIDPSKIPAGKSATNILIFTAPVGSDEFTPLPTTVVDATHVSATTSHFSAFFPGIGASCATNQECPAPSICFEQSCSIGGN